MRSTSSFSLLSCLALLFSLSSASSHEHSTHRGDHHDTTNDMICHPSTSDGGQLTCYPRIFQPTEDFQPIHDDQHIPAGIHLRLNLATGQKEGRINSDADGASDQEGVVQMALDESNNNQAVAVIANEEESGLDHDDILALQGNIQQSLREKSGKTPPAYSNDGKIKPAPPDSDEHGIFSTAVETLLAETEKSSSLISGFLSRKDDQETAAQRINAALDNLEELAHSLYWGHRLLSSEQTVAALFALLQQDPNASIRANAALVLGSAVQNNPAGLAALTAQFDNDASTSASASSSASPISLTISALSAEKDPKVAEKLMYLLSSIARGTGILSSSSSVLESELEPASATPSSTLSPETISTLQQLLSIFNADATRPDDGHERLRGRIALFIQDVVEALTEAADAQNPDQSAIAETDHYLVPFAPEHETHSAQDKLFYQWCRALQKAYTLYVSESSRGPGTTESASDSSDPPEPFAFTEIAEHASQPMARLSDGIKALRGYCPVAGLV